MPPPKSRTELEHNLYILVEDTNRKISSGDSGLIQNVLWATVPHLEKVKKSPNNRVNILTVNEMVRNQANMMEWMSHLPPLSIDESSKS